MNESQNLTHLDDTIDWRVSLDLGSDGVNVTTWHDPSSLVDMILFGCLLLLILCTTILRIFRPGNNQGRFVWREAPHEMRMERIGG